MPVASYQQMLLPFIKHKVRGHDQQGLRHSTIAWKEQNGTQGNHTFCGSDGANMTCCEEQSNFDDLELKYCGKQIDPTNNT